MVHHIQALVFGHCRRRGHLDDQAELIAESEHELDELGIHHAASVQGVIPFGARRGQQATLFGESMVNLTPRPEKKLCADHEGYSLHAAIRISSGSGSRARLERLCRYITRPAFAQDRLTVARDGSIVYRFRNPWRNGKLAVVMDPMTFLSRLAAQIPPPRFHMLSYYGVLAPAASRREEIVPGPGPDVDEVQSSCDQRKQSDGSVEETAGAGRSKRPRPERMLWAQLLRRTFLHDALSCQCGGRRRVLAMIFRPESIERILRHLGLPHQSPARAPPRPPPARLPFPA